MKYHVLYNPLAGTGEVEDSARCLSVAYPGDELCFYDMTQIDYLAFAKTLDGDDALIICGGDGTLNRFVNDTTELELTNKILYYPVGSGNDFARDLGRRDESMPFEVTNFLKNLPEVTVNGCTRRFINGVGYGIDGHCCEVGDRLRAEGKKNINYTIIAIKGLLFHFQPRRAVVTVDGESHTYEKVWIAPTMLGRYYGGGMMPTPRQYRGNAARTVSVMVFYGKGRLRTMTVFPSIFKGLHVKHKDMVAICQGKDIRVEFDRPTPLQIDGETVLDVTGYEVKAPAVAEKKKEFVNQGV